MPCSEAIIIASVRREPERIRQPDHSGGANAVVVVGDNNASVRE